MAIREFNAAVQPNFRAAGRPWRHGPAGVLTRTPVALRRSTRPARSGPRAPLEGDAA